MKSLIKVLQGLTEKLGISGLQAGQETHGEIRVLAVMPRDQDSQALARIAEKANWKIEFASSRADALSLIKRHRFAVILCDRGLSLHSNWSHSIEDLASQAPESSVILASPANDDRLWQEVISRGGFDVLTKPFQEERVIRSVRFACKHPKNAGSLS